MRVCPRPGETPGQRSAGTAEPPAIAALIDPADGATLVTVRRILSRCGLILVVAAGLAAGVAGRLMWQPRVVAAPAGAGQSTGDEREITTQPKSSLGTVTAPRGVDPDVWQLLQGHSKAGGWAATLERLQTEGCDDLSALVMLAWCEADGTAALSWLADRSTDKWPGGGAVWQWIANHPGVSWEIALAKDSLALARVAVGSPSALAADPAVLRQILDAATGRRRSVIVELARQFGIQADNAGFLKLAAADFDTAARLLRLGAHHFSLLAELLEADPAAAQKLLAHGSAREQAGWQALLAPHIARSDPNAAEEILAKMPAGSAKDSAAVRLALSRVDSDPEAALALAEKLGVGKAMASVQSAALKKLAVTDPAAALAAAETINASQKDAIGWQALDAELFGVFSGVDRNRAFALAVRTNGYAAISLLNSKNQDEAANGLAFLREFGATDADAATRAVSIMNAGNKEEIKSLAEGALDNPLTTAARIWLATQPVNADAVKGQPSLRPNAPDAAMAQTLSALDPSMVQPRMFADTASAWVRQAPEQASHWVADLPAGPARDAAIGGLVNALTGEPQGSSGWFTSSLTTGFLPVRQLGDDVEIESAVAVGSDDAKPSSSADLVDYPSAMAWSAAAGDPIARAELILKTARRWLDADPSAAAEGVRMIGLPADERQQLLRELGMSP